MPVLFKDRRMHKRSVMHLALSKTTYDTFFALKNRV